MSDYLDFKKCLRIGQIFEKKAQQKIMNCYENKYHVVTKMTLIMNMTLC